MSISFTPSTLNALNTRRDTVLRLQSELDRAATEVATGRHADSYQALGRNAAQVLGLEADLKRTEAFRTSNEMLGQRMDATTDALGAIRGLAEEMLALAIPNAGSPEATARTLATQARSVLDQIAGHANASYQGRALFAGVATDARALPGWNQAGPGGQSPADMIAGVTGGAVTSAADATAKADALDARFAELTDAAGGFRDVFYGGAPAEGARQIAQIDEGETLDWAVQADDPAFRDLL